MSAGKVFVLLLAGAALGVGAGAAFWLAPGASVETSSRPAGALPRAAITAAPAPIVGAPAPDFTLTDLQDHSVNLYSFGHKAVLINFWATWCDPCREELPVLDRIAKKYESSLSVIAVETGESKDDVRSFAESLSIVSLTVLLDPSLSVRRLYLVRGLPTSFFIDSSGIVQQVKIGALGSSEVDAILSRMGVVP